MSALDELFAAPHTRRRRGCNICGNTVEAQLNVQLRRADDRGAHLTGKGSTTSRTWSLCGDHAAAAFRKTQSMLDEGELQ